MFQTIVNIILWFIVFRILFVSYKNTKPSYLTSYEGFFSVGVSASLEEEEQEWVLSLLALALTLALFSVPPTDGSYNIKKKILYPFIIGCKSRKSWPHSTGHNNIFVFDYLSKDYLRRKMVNLIRRQVVSAPAFAVLLHDLLGIRWGHHCCLSNSFFI